MAINYTTLTGAKSTAGSIKDWINYASLPSADILTEAEAWIYSRIRTREMRSEVEVTISSGASTASLPAGFIDPISFQLYEDGYPLPYLDEGSLESLRYRDSAGAISSGRPGNWAIYNELLQFDYLADAEYKGRMVYYKTPDALAASSNETNFLTDRYPTLLRRVCMAFAYEFRKNTKQYQSYISLAEHDVFEVNKEADLNRSGAYYDIGV